MRFTIREFLRLKVLESPRQYKFIFIGCWYKTHHHGHVDINMCNHIVSKTKAYFEKIAVGECQPGKEGVTLASRFWQRRTPHSDAKIVMRDSVKNSRHQYKNEYKTCGINTKHSKRLACSFCSKAKNGWIG